MGMVESDTQSRREFNGEGVSVRVRELLLAQPLNPLVELGFSAAKRTLPNEVKEENEELALV